jgi:hypothetical protein
MHMFKKAAEDFKQKHGKRVIILLEDIHGLELDGSLPPVITSFLGDLMNLYLAGLVSVVFTVSDVRVIPVLKAGNCSITTL